MNKAFRIRNFKSSDEPACYEICLKTGDDGADGTHLFTDPRLLGHIYVGPYLRYDPELALVLEDEEGVCGYCIGALDSAKFYKKFSDEWLPSLRKTHPKPECDSVHWTEDQKLCQFIHEPSTFYPPEFAPWPSHLHIDLLPRAQSNGCGKQLMHELESLLIGLGSPGVHLAMSPLNNRALAFYQHLGYKPMPEIDSPPDDVLYLGKTLS